MVNLLHAYSENRPYKCQFIESLFFILSHHLHKNQSRSMTMFDGNVEESSVCTGGGSYANLEMWYCKLT